ncbi:MAG: ABC transporter permease [Myxococcales bacterium]|jgi:putative ABC transport system permease protein
MRLLLRLAWRNIWRQPRRTWLTVAAMAVGCAACMACIALADGMFSDGFKILVRQSLGHVQIHAPKYPKQRSLHESMDEAVVAELDKLADAAGVSGRAYGYALLGAATSPPAASSSAPIPRARGG